MTFLFLVFITYILPLILGLVLMIIFEFLCKKLNRKNDSAKEITKEIIEKVHDNFVKYYLDYNYDAMYGMRVDYDPTKDLYNLLKDSGVPEKHIRSLCPWKTGIYIDEKDNSVVYCSYSKREYL